MRTGLVSVVVPTYQSERTLGAALSSALTQSYPDVEVVVCIDGATDRSQAIAEAHGDLVRVVVQENGGLAAARNAAIAAAEGELIALLDADDILLPQFVERTVSCYRNAGTDRAFVATNAVKMSRHGLVGPIFRKAQADPAGQRMGMLEQNIATGHALFPRAMWDELGGYAEELRALEDWDFWTRAVFHGWTLHVLPEPAALYRLTPGSLSSRRELMEEQYQAMRRHVLATTGDLMSAEERAFFDTTLASKSSVYLRSLAADALAEGDVPRTAELMRQASVIAPSDRRMRIKAELLTRVPASARYYRWREQRRLAAQER